MAGARQIAPLLIAWRLLGAVVVATPALATLGRAVSQTASEVPPGDGRGGCAPLTRLRRSPQKSPTACAVQARASQGRCVKYLPARSPLSFRRPVATLATGVAQVVTGRLVDWFSRKLNARSGPPADGAAPGSTRPAPRSDHRVRGTQSPGGPLVAGLAFEVHRDGPVAVRPCRSIRSRTSSVPAIASSSTSVPACPGRMDVFNINPAGQSDPDRYPGTRCRRSSTRLGPYEFAAMTGDEQLRSGAVPVFDAGARARDARHRRVPTAVPTGPESASLACNAR